MGTSPTNYIMMPHKKKVKDSEMDQVYMPSQSSWPCLITSHCALNTLTTFTQGHCMCFSLCLENTCSISPVYILITLRAQLKGPFLQAAFHEHFLLQNPTASWALCFMPPHSTLSLSGGILSWLGSRARLPEIESWLCSLLAVWPCEVDLNLFASVYL